MSPVLVIILLVVYQVGPALSYSKGAPDDLTGVCSTLVPKHGNSTANGPAPYSLSFSANIYIPGDVIQGTLSGLNGTQFKGYLIVARASSGSTDNIGNFSAEPGSHVTCSGALGNGLTQSNNSIRSSVSFNWTAPLTSVGDVVFYYTVIRGGAPNTTPNRADYFQNLKSATLKSADQNSFPKNPECGQTRGCYSNCVNNNCDWELSWKNAGANYDIIIKSIVSGGNTYVALGFTNRSAMNAASVVACVLNNGSVSVSASYNSQYSNQLLPNPKEGISNETNSYNNNVLQCSFSRVTVSNNTQIYNLTEPWYVITAKGPANADGSLGIHTNRYKTSMKIDLSSVTTDDSFASASTTTSVTTASPGSSASSVTTVTPPSGGTFPIDPECSKTKGCYAKCTNDLCTLLISWESMGDNFEITLKSAFAVTGNHYIAFGLSDDYLMYPASVVACTVYQSQVGVYASYNPSYENDPLPNATEGLSSIKGSFQDGILTCTALRETSSANPKIFNLTELWYLIAATGEAKQGGGLVIHDKHFQSDGRINFTNTDTHSAKTEEYPLVKAHGCLMAITWMFTASLGLTMARFFKKLWPDSKICGVKIWFAIHRAAMVSAFVIGLTGFAIIFIQVKAYSVIEGETYKKAHPILGIIVTSLLFINPFMSLLRCGPDHPNRWIFNWAHWLVGTSAHILGGVTVTLGLYLPKANLKFDKGLIIMIVYFGWYLIYFFIMSLIDLINNSRTSKTAAFQSQPLEMTDVPESQGKKSYDLLDSRSQNGLGKIQEQRGLLKAANEPPFSGVKKLLTLAHLVVLTGLTASLMYLIITGDI